MENKKLSIDLGRQYREELQRPWGKQPEVRVRRDSVAMKVLKGVALTGLVLIAASNPYFGVYAGRVIKKAYRRRQWIKLQQSLRYLKSRGYVKIISVEEEGMKVEITRVGEKLVKRIDVIALTLDKPATWDAKWRVVIFDVPNYKSKNRAAFRERIKELGFQLVQKSVWVYPHEAREVVMILRKFYDIEKYVTYLETTHSEDEDQWLRNFHMEDKRA